MGKQRGARHAPRYAAVRDIPASLPEPSPRLLIAARDAWLAAARKARREGQVREAEDCQRRALEVERRLPRPKTPEEQRRDRWR